MELDKMSADPTTDELVRRADEFLAAKIKYWIAEGEPLIACLRDRVVEQGAIIVLNRGTLKTWTDLCSLHEQTIASLRADVIERMDAEIASLRAQLAERDPAQCAICQSYHHVGPHSIQWSATESSEAHPPNAEGTK